MSETTTGVIHDIGYQRYTGPRLGRAYGVRSLYTHSLRTALFWARYRGKPIVLSPDLAFCQKLWGAYRDEAAKHGHRIRPGEEAGWGGLLVLAESKGKAQQWAQDMLWFWDSWSRPFGQDYPELLIGDPDSVSRRIEEATRAVPIDECFLLLPQGIHDRDQILTSLDLFARKVMPRFAG